METVALPLFVKVFSEAADMFNSPAVYLGVELLFME